MSTDISKDPAFIALKWRVEALEEKVNPPKKKSSFWFGEKKPKKPETVEPEVKNETEAFESMAKA